MKSPFGSVRQLPSVRWQARLTVRGERIPAPTTFATAADAWKWLDRAASELPRAHRGCPACTCPDTPDVDG